MVFINLVRSGPASFTARRKPWMVGDDLTLSLTARCFASGLSDFPGDEGGGVFSTVESRKGLARPKQARVLG